MASKAAVIEKADEEEYRVLYQRFRPHTFASVIGQEHATEPLRRSVESGKVPHALLLSGDRGCGKTTSARIIAAALNCDNMVGGEPCGVCMSCEAIFSPNSSSPGVFELDAANNRAIADVRELIDTMHVGSLARKKVYIIDEVHRLTTDAAVALLKTVEEPPPNVHIILATTNPDKLPQPLRSRCTSYRFRTLGPEVMEGLVRDVAAEAKIEVDDDTLASVIAAGKGSPRDTLSALEIIAAGGEINLASSTEEISAAVAADSVSDAIVAVAAAVKRGEDPSGIASGLLVHWRNCLLQLRAPELLTVTGKELDSVRADAKALGTRRTISALRIVAEAEGRMTLAGDPRLLLETSLLTLLLPEAASDLDSFIDSVMERFDRLDRKIADLMANGPVGGWPGVDSVSPADAVRAALGTVMPEIRDAVADGTHDGAVDALREVTQPQVLDEDDIDPAEGYDAAAESAVDEPEDDRAYDDEPDDEDDRGEPDEEPESEPEDEPDDEPEPDTRSPEDVLDDALRNASKRLAARMRDVKVEFADPVEGKRPKLDIDGANDISDALYEELKELVSAEGYRLEYFFGND